MNIEERKAQSGLENAVQQLLQSPRLPQLVGQFQAVLEAEREKRQRFYAEMSEQQKIEFINGEIIVQTPVKWNHSQAGQYLFTLLHAFVQKNHLGFVGHEKLLVSLSRNDYEPDIAFWGQAKARSFSADQVRFPAPDLIVEVLSPSTEAVDRGIKFDDYALHSVAEYWLVNPDEQYVEQYILQESGYELQIKAKSGTLQSQAIPGFEIPVRALFDSAENLASLQKIVA